jgi:hypothetical protein
MINEDMREDAMIREEDDRVCEDARIRESDRVFRSRNNGNTTIAATAGPAAADENDAMDETDESGNEYRSSSPSDSPGDTQPTPSSNLNRLLNQGAVAPALGGESGSGSNDRNNAPRPSIFRHAVPSSGTTALTGTNLTAALERRFTTPANLDANGTRTPSSGDTADWRERVVRSRGPIPGSVMGQQGSVEEGGDEEGDAERGVNGNGDQNGDREGNGEGNSNGNTTNSSTASSASPNATTPARRVYATADLNGFRQTTDSTTPSSPAEGWGLVSARGRGRGRPTRGDYRNANLDGSGDVKDDATPAAISEPSDAELEPEEDADGSQDGSYGDVPYTSAGGLPSSSAAASSESAQQQSDNSSQAQGSSQSIEPYRFHGESETPSSSANAPPYDDNPITRVHDSTLPTLAEGDRVGSSQPEQRQFYDNADGRYEEAETNHGYGDTPPTTQRSQGEDE